MHLIQFLLPLEKGEGHPLLENELSRLQRELAERFGGVTAFLQSPAEGMWAPQATPVERDRVVLIEVMAQTLDEAWWANYRAQLEKRFHQEELVVRAWPVTRL